MLSHYQQSFSFVLHTKHTKNSFRKKRDAEAISSVCLNLSMPQWQKTDACKTLTNIFLKPLVLKQQWQGKRIGMFTKTRKANKVKVKNRAIIPVLICYVFQSFSTVIHSKTLHIFLNKLQHTNFFLLCENDQFCISPKMGQKKSNLLNQAKNSQIST